MSVGSDWLLTGEWDYVDVSRTNLGTSWVDVDLWSAVPDDTHALIPQHG